MPENHVTLNSVRMQRAQRINNIEETRLNTRLYLMDKEKRHQMRMTTQDMRMVNLTLEYIQSSSGYSPEALPPDYVEPVTEKEPEACFMYGERLRRWKRSRRVQSAPPAARNRPATTTAASASGNGGTTGSSRPITADTTIEVITVTDLDEMVGVGTPDGASTPVTRPQSSAPLKDPADSKTWGSAVFSVEKIKAMKGEADSKGNGVRTLAFKKRDPRPATSMGLMPHRVAFITETDNRKDAVTTASENSKDDQNDNENHTQSKGSGVKDGASGETDTHSKPVSSVTKSKIAVRNDEPVSENDSKKPLSPEEAALQALKGQLLKNIEHTKQEFQQVQQERRHVAHSRKAAITQAVNKVRVLATAAKRMKSVTPMQALVKSPTKTLRQRQAWQEKMALQSERKERLDAKLKVFMKSYPMHRSSVEA